MAITTYTELQAGVKRWLHRGDLDALIPDFITLGEARLNRLLRLPALQSTVTITPSTVDRFVALPSRFFELLSFVDDQGNALREATAAWLETAAVDASPGRPGYYRLTSRIDFERVADTAYSFALTYRQRLDLATDGSNEVLLRHPDTYLYSALLAAAPYINDDRRATTWSDLFRAAVQEANETVRGHVQRRSGLPAADVFDIRVG
jgi:hypothetical protein